MHVGLCEYVTFFDTQSNMHRLDFSYFSIFYSFLFSFFFILFFLFFLFILFFIYIYIFFYYYFLLFFIFIFSFFSSLDNASFYVTGAFDCTCMSIYSIFVIFLPLAST